jgi:hypothetical protein
MISYEIPSHISGDTWSGIPCITFLRNGSAINLSGAYVNMQVRLSVDSPLVLDLNTKNGGITITPPTSSGNISIPPQIIDIPIATYKYNLQLSLSSGEVKTEMAGIWKIVPNIFL